MVEEQYWRDVRLAENMGVSTARAASTYNANIDWICRAEYESFRRYAIESDAMMKAREGR
jgi:hypothetical protein